jgi:hypothetical protein
VVRAASAGDDVAITILERQADEVITIASAALRRLRLTRRDVTVVLGGSILAALPDSIVDRVQSGVRLTAPRATCVVCRDRPILGAALTTLDLAGAGATPRLRIRRSLNESQVHNIAP